jgi:hypothetical protein
MRRNPPFDLSTVIGPAWFTDDKISGSPAEPEAGTATTTSVATSAPEPDGESGEPAAHVPLLQEMGTHGMSAGGTAGHGGKSLARRRSANRRVASASPHPPLQGARDARAPGAGTVHGRGGDASAGRVAEA